MFSFSLRRFHTLVFLPVLFSFLWWGRSVAPGSGPVAVDDSFQVHGATYLGSLLANDYTPDHGAILFDSLVSLPQHGTLGGVGYPTAPLYNPDHGYVGTDSYTYRMCDSLALCATATVTLNVVNNAPVAVDDSFTVHGATYLDSVLANDYDPDHDAILFDSFVSLPQHGILAGVGYPTAPLYVPDSGYSGTDSYTYRICDVLGLCAVGNVYLQINGDATPTPTPSPTPTPTPTPSNLNLGDSCPDVGGPVNVTNGNMYLRQADYQLPG